MSEPRSEIQHTGVADDGVPFGRAVKACPSRCGMLACAREVDHEGKHVSGFVKPAIIWPVEDAEFGSRDGSDV